MALVDMKVFSSWVQTAARETLAQRVDAFNAASNGAIQLTTQGVSGDYLQRASWKSLQNAQRRVDRYATNGAATATPLAQLQHNSVKVAGGFGPVMFEPGQLSWIEKDVDEAIAVISGELADAIVLDQLNTAIAALVAAIGNVASAVNDVSATEGITYSAINGGHALFGDASGQLAVQVMTGQVAHKLIGQNLTNAQQLFQADNVNVFNILGRPVVVTDSPALYEAGTPNKQKVLSLATGAAVISEGGDLIVNTDSRNGKERIETTMQADYTFVLGLRGYAWDVTNGGKSPIDSELRTGSNWDMVGTNVKATAGVMTVGDAAK